MANSELFIYVFIYFFFYNTFNISVFIIVAVVVIVIVIITFSRVVLPVSLLFCVFALLYYCIAHLKNGSGAIDIRWLVAILFAF